MKYLLDTNIVIEVLRANRTILDCLRQKNPVDLAISSVVAYELLHGAFRSARKAESIASVDALRFPIVPFDAEDARRAGGLRAVLEATGRTIGPYDVLIAGQALSRDLILVTGNVREFSRVEGLAVENWIE